jgi:hypothetical protein
LDRHIKAYHDRHIKKKEFKQGDLVLVYDSKFIKHPGKFRMHWLGPYEIACVTEGGVAQLKTLKGHYYIWVDYSTKIFHASTSFIIFLNRVGFSWILPRKFVAISTKILI